MSKALVTAAGPNMHEMLACSEPTFEQFAGMHGYELIVEHDVVDSPDRKDSQARAARWAKVGFIRRALEEHNLVVWMDADAMITKFDRDIADDFETDCFQGFALEQWRHRFNPNSGVWALRQEPMSFEFLDTIVEIGQQPIFADQGAICKALGWEITQPEKGSYIYGKPVHPSKFLARTAWLPPEWNPLGMARYSPDPRVKHFAGMPNDQRLQEMRKLYTALVKTGVLKDGPHDAADHSDTVTMDDFREHMGRGAPVSFRSLGRLAAREVDFPMFVSDEDGTLVGNLDAAIAWLEDRPHHKHWKPGFTSVLAKIAAQRQSADS